MTIKSPIDIMELFNRAEEDDLPYVHTAIEAGYGANDPEAIPLLLISAVEDEARKVTEYLIGKVSREAISTALPHACRSNKTSCFNLLVNLADHDYNDSDALVTAAITLDPIKIERLIPTSDTQAVIARLTYTGHHSQVRIFSAKLGAMIADGSKTLTRQEKITQLIINDDIEAIRYLIENGEDMTFGNHRPIRMATLLNRTDIAKELLTCSNSDSECLQVAVREENTTLTELFLHHSIPDKGTMTHLLLIAIDTENRELIKHVVSFSPQSSIDENRERLGGGNMTDKLAMLDSIIQENALKQKFSIDSKQHKRTGGL